jgi:hypothetical protein
MEGVTNPDERVHLCSRVLPHSFSGAAIAWLMLLACWRRARERAKRTRPARATLRVGIEGALNEVGVLIRPKQR